MACTAGAPAMAQLGDSSTVVQPKAYASVDAVRPGDHFRIAVVLSVEPGWHVNSATPSEEGLIPTEVSFEAAEGVHFEGREYPPGGMRTFSFTDKPISVYDGDVRVLFDVAADESVTPGERVLTGTVSFQPCNDTSCLAPAEARFELPIKIVAPGTPVQLVHQDVFAQATGAAAPSTETGAEEGRLAAAFERAGLLGALPLAFVIGLALNLTPCVYPLISVTISFFGGQASDRRSSVLSLAAVYVLGIVVSYSVLGTVAAATHALFGFLLQNVVVLVAVALLIAALAASMWGLFEIPTPAFVSRVGQSKRGLAGALLMGLTMGLVSAPCIGPFIVGLLAYVARVGSLGLGFVLFFVMSLGLGVPYLVLAAFSGSINRLPRSGMWMVWVKRVFALILLGVAAYFIKPLIGSAAFHIVLAVVALAGGVYLGIIYRVRGASAGFRWVRGAFVVVALAAGGWFAYAALPRPGIEWSPYSPEAVGRAADAGQPVMIDFTAAWCLPCDELDSRTFTDPAVRREAARFVTLQVDLTRETPEAAATYHVLGPPTIVFIDSRGQEQRDARVTGFVRPGVLLGLMRQVR